MNTQSFRSPRLVREAGFALSIALLLSLASVTGAQVADPNSTPQADALWNRLLRYRSLDQFLFGQEDANVYGIQTNNARWLTDNDTNTNRSDVKSVTGSHPAVFAFSPLEVVGVGPSPQTWLGTNEWRNRVRDAHRWGGVITIYYPPEQVFYTNGWVAPTLASVQTNGIHYAALTNGIHNFASLLDGLLDDNGDPIPFVLRPWHEYTGGWFWWSPANNATDQQQYINLFRKTVDILRARGHHSCLTALSPAGHRLGVDRDFFFAYPGDGYVDVYCVDEYFCAPRDFVDQGGGYPTNAKTFNLDSQFWQAVTVTADAVLSKETNGIIKLMGIAEFGPPDGIWGNTNLTAQTSENFFNGLFLPGLVANVPLAKRQLIGYAATWRNAGTTHGWTPNTAHPAAPDLVDFYNDGRAIFLNELGAHWRFENDFTDSQGGLPLAAPAGATAPAFGTNHPNLPLPGFPTNARAAIFDPTVSNALENASAQALTFDGAARSYTLETFVRLDTLPAPGGRSVIISAKPAGSSDVDANYIFAVDETGALTFKFGNGSTSATFTSTLALATGAWAHASASYDTTNNRVRFTRNGTRQFIANSFAFRPAPMGDVRVTVGANRAPGGTYEDFLDGRLDELRLSATLLATNALLFSNTPPTISIIADRTIAENTSTTAIAFTVGDAEIAESQLTLTGASSDTNLVAPGGIVFGGSGSNRTVTVTPLTNQFGSATITVTVSDGFLTAGEPFLLTVTNVNHAPVLAAVSNFTVAAGLTLTLTNSATDLDAPPQLLTFAFLTSPTGATLNATSGVFNWRPAAVQAGSTNLIKLKVADDGTPGLSATQQFTVTVPLVAVPDISNFIHSSGQMRVRVDGDFGPDYFMQASSNLVSWATVNIRTSAAVPYTYVDTNWSNFTKRFYRVLLVP
ncbi:MAG: hypothetical protein HY301_21190 [Verrucomicrobia bacterium]|nr:hypothetical protein [Verrucomicrobiota bacterium]